MFLIFCLFSIAIGINGLFYWWLIHVVLDLFTGYKELRVLNACYIPITAGLALGGSYVIWWLAMHVVS